MMKPCLRTFRNSLMKAMIMASTKLLHLSCLFILPSCPLAWWKFRVGGGVHFFTDNKASPKLVSLYKFILKAVPKNLLLINLSYKQWKYKLRKNVCNKKRRFTLPFIECQRNITINTFLSLAVVLDGFFNLCFFLDRTEGIAEICHWWRSTYSLCNPSRCQSNQWQHFCFHLLVQNRYSWSHAKLGTMRVSKLPCWQ